VKKDKKYEFGSTSNAEKAKIIIARVIVFSVMLASLLAAVLGHDTDESGRLHNAGLFSVGVFFYINLLRIELEFSEILEWTFDHKGVEFAILGGALTTYAFYLDYIA
jgi:hypothetical protein